MLASLPSLDTELKMLINKVFHTLQYIFISEEQSSRFKDLYNSICAAALLHCHSVESNTLIADSNSTTCCTSNFMMHLQREMAAIHLLTQPPRLSVCLSSRDKYRTSELILMKPDIGNFCNFFPPLRYFG